MSNDCLLIQQVSENSEHINLLKITTVRNLDYCLLHKTDYELLVSGNVLDQGGWEKVRLIRAAMELPYKYIVYLDADTVIVDMKSDLRDGCPPDKIGACRHILTNPPYSAYLDHLNVGALYVSNCEATRAFVDEWLAGFPGTTDPPWYEQGVFNRLRGDIVIEIDAKYNATGQVNPSPNPVVLGFHGQGDVRQRFDLMCAAIGK